MNTDKEEPLYKAESRQIIGSAMDVLNETSLQPGHILNCKHAKLEWKRVIL